MADISFLSRSVPTGTSCPNNWGPVPEAINICVTECSIMAAIQIVIIQWKVSHIGHQPVPESFSSSCLNFRDHWHRSKPSGAKATEAGLPTWKTTWRDTMNFFFSHPPRLAWGGLFSFFLSFFLQCPALSAVYLVCSSNIRKGRQDGQRQAHPAPSRQPSA